MRMELDGAALDGEPSGSMSEVEWNARGRSSVGGGRERGGNPQRRIRATPAWAAAGTGGCALSTVSTITMQ
jgi:hypothetical protein